MYLKNKIEPNKTISKINYLLFLFLLLSSLLTLIKLPIIDLAIHNFLLFLGSSLLIYLNSERRTIINHIKPLLFIIIIITWCLITALLSDYQTTALMQTVKYLNYPLVFLAFLLAITKTKNKIVYYQIVINFLHIIGILGIIEYFCPQLWLFDLFKDDTFYPRISSLLQNPNSFGTLMAITGIISFIFYKQKQGKIIILLLQELVFITAISLSASRNAWLVLIVGLGLLIYHRLISYKLIWLLGAICVMSILYLPVSQYRIGLGDILSSLPLATQNQALELPSPKGTALSRLLLWKQAIAQFRQHPITGLGLGVFAEHISIKVFGKSGFNTHNLWLDVLVSLGLPGLLMVATGVWKLWQKINQLDFLITIPLILLLVSQLIDFFLYDFTFTIIEIFCIAIALVKVSENTTSPPIYVGCRAKTENSRSVI